VFKNSVASLRLFVITRTPVRDHPDTCSASFGITVRDHRNTQNRGLQDCAISTNIDAGRNGVTYDLHNKWFMGEKFKKDVSNLLEII